MDTQTDDGIWTLRHMPNMWTPRHMTGMWTSRQMTDMWTPRQMMDMWTPRQMLDMWTPRQMTDMWTARHAGRVDSNTDDRHGDIKTDTAQAEGQRHSQTCEASCAGSCREWGDCQWPVWPVLPTSASLLTACVAAHLHSKPFTSKSTWPPVLRVWQTNRFLLLCKEINICIPHDCWQVTFLHGICTRIQFFKKNNVVCGMATVTLWRSQLISLVRQMTQGLSGIFTLKFPNFFQN